MLTFGWIPVFLLLPRLRDILEATETPLAPVEGDASWIMRYGDTRGWWTSIGVNGMLSFVTIVGMSNSLLMVLVNYSSPNKSALGAVNGIATAVGVSCNSNQRRLHVQLEEEELMNVSVWLESSDPRLLAP